MLRRHSYAAFVLALGFALGWSLRLAGTFGFVVMFAVLWLLSGVVYDHYRRRAELRALAAHRTLEPAGLNPQPR